MQNVDTSVDSSMYGFFAPSPLDSRLSHRVPTCPLSGCLDELDFARPGSKKALYVADKHILDQESPQPHTPEHPTKVQQSQKDRLFIRLPPLDALKSTSTHLKTTRAVPFHPTLIPVHKPPRPDHYDPPPKIYLARSCLRLFRSMTYTPGTRQSRTPPRRRSSSQ